MENTPRKIPNRLLQFSIAEWIAVLGILTVVISFIWEWGYWGGFGVSFAEMPMSLENLASSMLAWFPQLWFPVASLVFFMVSVRRVQSNFNLWVIFAILLLLIKFVVSHLIAIFTEGVVSYVVIWLLLMGILMVPRAMNSIPDGIWGSLFIALVLSYFYVAAQDAAYNDVNGGLSRAYVSFTENGNAEKKEMIVLRSNSDFIFVYDLNAEEMTVLSWENVSSVTFPSAPKNYFEIPFLADILSDNDEEQK